MYTVFQKDSIPGMSHVEIFCLVLQALTRKYILLTPSAPPRYVLIMRICALPHQVATGVLKGLVLLGFSVWVARWYRKKMVLEEIVFSSPDKRSENNQGSPSLGTIAPPDDSHSVSWDPKCGRRILKF